MGRHSLTNHRHLTGTSNEYLAAAMYLSRGFQVYWPSDQHTPVDFVVEMDGCMYKVQVKTAREKRNCWAAETVSSNNRRVKGSRHYDLLVILSPEGDMWEIPADLIRSDYISLGRIDGTGKENAWHQFKTR